MLGGGGMFVMRGASLRGENHVSDVTLMGRMDRVTVISSNPVFPILD